MAIENQPSQTAAIPVPEIETNKARIYQLSDEVIVKQYFTDDAVERTRQDERSLSYVQTHFGEVSVQGWRYYAPQFFGRAEDKKSYQMEFVSGRPLSELSRREIGDAEYHAGVWLALYHERIVGDKDWGLIFSDFNVNNILIDLEKRQIAAIDPGVSWGKLNTTHEDLVHHVHSLLTTLVFNRSAPFKALFRFLDGYYIKRNRAFSMRTHFQGFKQDYQRKFRRFGRKSLSSRLSFYGVFILLLPIHFLIVPGYVKLRCPSK